MEPIEFEEVHSEERRLKDIREIKRSLKLIQGDFGTHVIAIAESRCDENMFLEIPVEGEAIGATVTDLVRDAYHVMAASYHIIGKIPVNYRIESSDSNWSEHVTLPPSVIMRHMNEEQRIDFDCWKSKHKDSKYRITFLQSIGVFYD